MALTRVNDCPILRFQHTSHSPRRKAVFGFGKDRKEPLPPSAVFQDVVGTNSSFEGDLKSDGNVRIDGFLSRRPMLAR